MPDQVELKVDVLTSGGDRLDQLVQSVLNIERSLTSAAAPLKKMEDGIHSLGSGADSESEKIKKFGESIRQHIETPIGSASVSIGRLLETLGPIGVGLGATGAVLGTMGITAFETMKKLGDLGTEINNVSIRTGLSTQEVGLFTFAAKAAGSDITSLEMGMRILSRALSDNSEEGKKAKDALNAVGIQATDMYGNAVRSSDLFLQMSDAMGKMSTMAERNTFAMDVMGRAGLELVPMLLKLRENIEFAKESGAEVFGSSQIAQMEEYHREVLQLENAWDKVTHAIEGAIAKAGSFILTGSGLLSSEVFDKHDAFLKRTRGEEFPDELKEKPAPIEMATLRTVAHDTLPPVGAGGIYRINPNAGIGAPTDYYSQGQLEGIDQKLQPLYQKARAGSLNKDELDEQNKLLDQKKALQKKIEGEDPYSESAIKSRLEANQTGLKKQLDDAANSGDWLKRSLEGVDKSLKEIHDKAEAGTLTLKDLADARGFERQKKAIEDQIEAIKKAEDATKALHLLNTAVDNTGLTGADRLQAERDNELAKFRAEGVATTPVGRAELATRASQNTRDVALERTKQEQADAERIRKARDAMVRQQEIESNRHVGRMAELQPNSDEERGRVAAEGKIDAARKLFQFDQAEASAQFEREDHAATTKQQHDEAAQHRLETFWHNLAEFQQQDAQATDELDEKGAARDKQRLENLDKLHDRLRTIASDDQTDQLVRGLQHANTIAQLTSGPGNEGRAAEIGYDSRVAAAEAIRKAAEDTAEIQYEADDKSKSADEREAERAIALADAKKKYDDEIYDAREQREIKLLEMQMHALDSFRQGAGGIFDAITSKDPAKAMRDFWINQGKDVGRAIFENMAQPLFKPLQKAIDVVLPGQVQTDNQGVKSSSPIGQFLHGTGLLQGTAQQQIAAGHPIEAVHSGMITADPEIPSRSANTAAIVEQTAATVGLTAALREASGMFGGSKTGLLGEGEASDQGELPPLLAKVAGIGDMSQFPAAAALRGASGLFSGSKTGILGGPDSAVDGQASDQGGLPSLLAKVAGIGDMSQFPASLPKFGDGAIVTAPTNAIIGESGAEAVVPLDQFNKLGDAIDDLTSTLTYISTGGTSGALPAGASVGVAQGNAALAQSWAATVGAQSFDQSGPAAIATRTPPVAAAIPQAPGTASDSTESRISASLKSFTQLGNALASGASSGLSGLITGSTNVPGTDPGTAKMELSTTQEVGAGIGVAAQVAAGTMMAVHEFQRGGAKGDLGGVSSILGTASMIPGPQQPFVMAAAAITGIVSSLLGDPRIERQNQIAKTLFTQQYQAPQAINVSSSTNGGYSDVDSAGNVRTSNLSPYPTVTQSYLDVPFRYKVPGMQTSQFGGGATPTVVNHNYSIQAMDSQSFGTFLRQNAETVGEGVAHSLASAQTRLPQALRGTLGMT